jgi:hypothetical protein
MAEFDFDKLFSSSSDPILEPIALYATLEKSDPTYAYLRNVQAEVLEAWHSRRDERDLTIKMNTGSGKTTVGLVTLRSLLNEGLYPAVYVAADKFLAGQVITEAQKIGVDVTDDEDSATFHSGRSILVTYVHKLFNGRSRFGVGQEGAKIEIGSIVIDDAHACIDSIADQFRLDVPADHEAYSKIFQLFEKELEPQSPMTFRAVASGDKRGWIEIPFWSWQANIRKVHDILHSYRKQDPFQFKYPLVAGTLELSKCVVGGGRIEIGSYCIPVDAIPAFSEARRRLYMTATLADDSTLIRAFGVDPACVERPIAPKSSSDLGERMILIPQEVAPDFSFQDLKTVVQDFSKKYNVVVIVPSNWHAERWRDSADQVLTATNLNDGIKKLRAGVVGVSVLVNKYDGIDLPNDACRVLVLHDLPEAPSLLERSDIPLLRESEVTLRQQIQRIEQGMGRGIRSNEDHCVVLLFGSRLTRKIHVPAGKDMLSPATRTQIEVSEEMSAQVGEIDVSGLNGLMRQSLERNPKWVTGSRQRLVRSPSFKSRKAPQSAVILRSAFDAARNRRYAAASDILQRAVNSEADERMQAWLRVRLAELINFTDQAEAQRVLSVACENFPVNLKPVASMPYKRLPGQIKRQSSQVISYFSAQDFEDPTAILLWAREQYEDLVYGKGDSEAFEWAAANIGKAIGLSVQQPEVAYRSGPDVLWSLGNSRFAVIECKSESRSDRISKEDLGQLSVSMNWFAENYGNLDSATPVLFHPKRIREADAVPPADARVIDEVDLIRLADNFLKFCSGIAQPGSLADPKRVEGLLSSHSLAAGQLILAYSRVLT